MQSGLEFSECWKNCVKMHTAIRAMDMNTLCSMFAASVRPIQLIVNQAMFMYCKPGWEIIFLEMVILARKICHILLNR